MASKPQFNEDEDPINYLGFGIVSYFDLIKTMMFIFLILTLLHIPVMRIYASHNNFKEDTSEKFLRVLNIGNLGFSQTKCISSTLITDKIIMSCKTGMIADIVDFGFISRSEDKD